MPRFFKPLGGFPTAPAVKAIVIKDDGDTFQVMQDGTEKRTGYVAADQRWMPDRTIDEMENLVRGGSWMEVENADADVSVRPISPAAAPQPSPASGPVVTRAAQPQTAPANAPPVRGGDPASTNEQAANAPQPNTNKKE